MVEEFLFPNAFIAIVLTNIKPKKPPWSLMALVEMIETTNSILNRFHQRQQSCASGESCGGESNRFSPQPRWDARSTIGFRKDLVESTKCFR
jgi:hypothetical protein